LPGYKFLGWGKKADGGADFDFDEPLKSSVYKNLFIYAIWQGSGDTFIEALQASYETYAGYKAARTTTLTSGGAEKFRYTMMRDSDGNVTKSHYESSLIIAGTELLFEKTWRQDGFSRSVMHNPYLNGVPFGFINEAITPAEYGNADGEAVESLFETFSNAMLATAGKTYYSLKWQSQDSRISAKAYYGENGTLSKLEYTKPVTGGTETTALELFYDDADPIPEFPATIEYFGTHRAKMICNATDYVMLALTPGTLTNTDILANLKSIVIVPEGKTLGTNWLYYDDEFTQVVNAGNFTWQEGENVFYVKYTNA
jgi:hypothetical protein